MMHNTTSSHTKARRGFTLLEALVAVIGVSILAVGLSTIFSSISKTVTTGRRISAINSHAAVIERVMRRDFESMTREGFLVIRNEYAFVASLDATDPDRVAIPLSPEALQSRRQRRIDEIMFFSRGQFESARSPLDSNYVARGNAARIYYGHGQEQLEGTIGHATPFLDETNELAQLRLGLSGTANSIGEVNPNYYASNWTLLRHVTLLKVPQLHPVNQPGPLGLSPNVTSSLRLFQDNELQIAGQPAAAGIFRVETAIGRPFENRGFDAGRDGSFGNFNLREEVVSPLFESGVVDVATTSLNEIKRRMTTIYALDAFAPSSSSGGSSGSLEFFAGTPGDIFLLSTNFDAGQGYFTNVPLYNARDEVYGMSQSEFLAYRFSLQEQEFVLGNVFPFEPNTPFAEPMGVDDNVTGLQRLVDVQHAWMSDAFPGRSNERIWEGDDDWAINPDYSASWRGTDPRPSLTGAPPPYPSDRSVYEVDGARTRMRTEKSPPGYNADVFSPEAAEDYSDVQWAAYRGDQQIIGSSQFIPRCTEFIVEWSLGQSDPDTGQVVWYGHDPDGVNAPNRAGVVQRLRPEVTRPSPTDSIINATANPPVIDSGIQRNIEKHLLADLVNGLVTENGTRDEQSLRNRPQWFPLTHYFGYADPRAVPIDFNNDGIADAYDMNDDGIADDIDGDGNTLEDEWPWPKLVRITMSFADPIDQTIEETFQFIIEIPDGTGI
jgi:hypothetical protein